MKIGKLYLKIFFSFVFILIVIEILIFGLFMLSAGIGFRTEFGRFAGAQSLLIKEVIEEKIKTGFEKRIEEIEENEEVQKIILRLGEKYNALVWLESSDGTQLLKSFPGNVPSDTLRNYEKSLEDFGDFKIYFKLRKEHVMYVIIPLEIEKAQIGSIHILFKEMRIEMDRPKRFFGLGLFGIGIVIAMLIIPVSRLITKPVKQLEHSAIRIAGGELSHRVNIISKDEIGELGRAFNRMADKSERMIRGSKELTANISHELRSPLARIRIAEEMLREKLKDDSEGNLRRLLNGIREDIGELDQLIGRILELSKLDILETPVKNEHFNPSTLISKLLEKLKPAIKRRHIRIKTDLSFDSFVSGDKAAIRTALSNILENCVKFTPERGDIIVKTYSDHEGLIISATNTFSKLSGEDLSKIFEPFYHLYHCEESRESGSGLGLAITKKIIEMQGGSIEARNSEEGLNIRICFPI